MTKNYLQIYPIVKDAHQSIISEQGAAANLSIESLSSVKTMLLKDLIQILQVMDDVTMLLDKSTCPTIQNVDVLTESIVGRLNQYINVSKGDTIAQLVRQDILSRLYCLLNKFLVIGWCYRCHNF